MTNKDILKKIIDENVLEFLPERPDLNWIFDFRKVTLTPQFLDIYTKIFFEEFKDEKDFQVCGLESASIALVSGIVLESQKRNLNIYGFFIRKSAKKYDLFKVS
jgi:orotate phosphoribosyltransferase